MGWELASALGISEFEVCQYTDYMALDKPFDILVPLDNTLRLIYEDAADLSQM